MSRAARGSPKAKSQLAVALRYDGARAPTVVATGRGEIGRRIIETAQAHGVPLEQNAPLAEALSQVELETEIPVELYEAIAIVIGFVLRASAKASVSSRPSAHPPSASHN
jgi:flagellar biosynthesis protein